VRLILIGLVLALVGCQGPDQYHESLNHAQTCTDPPKYVEICTNNPSCSKCLDEHLLEIEAVPEIGCTFERADMPGRNLCVRDCGQCALDTEPDPK